MLGACFYNPQLVACIINAPSSDFLFTYADPSKKYRRLLHDEIRNYHFVAGVGASTVCVQGELQRGLVLCRGLCVLEAEGG